MIPLYNVIDIVGFTKEDIEYLTGALDQARMPYPFASRDEEDEMRGARRLYGETATLLRELRNQDTLFEAFYGAPVRGL